MHTGALSKQITTIFLDMNGTFMFGHDRLGNSQDFYPAYRSLGGGNMSAQALNTAVRRVIAELDGLYSAGQHDSDFPTVFDIASQTLTGAIERAELVLIEQTIASHEIGQVSDACKDALASLSVDYKLYVLSNLWSNSEPWKKYLSERLGESVLSGWLFSSDIGINKPEPEFFERAIALANVNPAEIAMVGDDYERDILPAAKLGMETVLIAPKAIGSQLVDRTISKLSQLAG